jgi:hypothetical protein
MNILPDMSLTVSLRRREMSKILAGNQWENLHGVHPVMYYNM